MMKKVLLLIGIFLMLFTVSVCAEDFEYKIIGNEAELVAYKGDEAVIIVPDTIDGYTVTSVGKAAFKLSNAEKIVLPDGIRTIGEGAFHLCKSLTEIKLPDNITEIPNSAFLGCYSLKRIEIPDTVTKIGNMAFASTALYEIALPEGITTIGIDTFWNCAKLEKVKLPDTVTRIEKNAFANCKSLKDIKLPEKLVFIGHGAFTESGLEKINLPDSVQTIENCAFQKCEGLTEARLPEGLTIISANMFYACGGLRTVNIPKSVTVIGEAAFSNCNLLSEIDIPDAVTEICDRAFLNCNSISELEIPHSLTEISNQAFANLKGIKEIVIPEGVVTIGDYAFAGCENVEKVTMPDTVTMIGIQSFAYNNKMAEITLPDSLEKIGPAAFMDNTALKEIYIPKGVKEPGERVFEGCVRFERIKVSDENEYITEKDGIVYSKDFTKLYFASPSITGDVIIAEGAVKIPERMFKGTKIKRVFMSDSVTEIGTEAFMDCGELEALVISDMVKVILPHTITGAKKLTWLVIGEGVEEIKSEGIYDCEIENLVFKGKDTKITRKHYFTTGGHNSSTTLPAFEGFYCTTVNTLFGCNGSDAQAYANERGFEFVDIETIKTDTYEDCTVLVYDNTAWGWVRGVLQYKIYYVKDACVTRYTGSNEDVVLVVDKDSDLVERRYHSVSSATSSTVMENVHALTKEDGRIYIQTKDGAVFERVYTNDKAENIPCSERVFENASISVYVDGKLVQADSEPYIKNDRTMVPMRAIFEALGATVEWYQAEHIATGTKGDIMVAVKIGDRMLYKNGEGIVLDATAEIKNNRTMVPVRARSEAFGCSVTWDDKTKSVIVEGVDKMWDYTYLAEKAEKATIYWTDDSLTVARTAKIEDKDAIRGLLQFVAECNFIKKEYDGKVYESDKRRSFSVYAKADTVSFEIRDKDILVTSLGKSTCYEIRDMEAFKKGIKAIFGINEPDEAEDGYDTEAPAE